MYQCSLAIIFILYIYTSSSHFKKSQHIQTIFKSLSTFGSFFNISAHSNIYLPVYICVTCMHPIEAYVVSEASAHNMQYVTS